MGSLWSAKTPNPLHMNCCFTVVVPGSSSVRGTHSAVLGLLLTVQWPLTVLATETSSVQKTAEAGSACRLATRQFWISNLECPAKTSTKTQSPSQTSTILLPENAVTLITFCLTPIPVAASQQRPNMWILASVYSAVSLPFQSQSLLSLVF